MSHPQADALTEEVVAEYLRENADFFNHHRQLLDGLVIPTQEQGAVSLVQIQLNRQRERIEALQEEITSLMSLAANNDRTFYDFMDLQERILKCEDFKSVVQTIETMAEQLSLVAYIRLFEHRHPDIALNREHFQRFCASHLNGKDAYLGRLRNADRDALFGEHTTPDLGSFAILPLVRKQTLGILAFSSSDGGHFQPEMDTLFLRHLSLTVAHLAQTLPWQCHNEEQSQRHNSTAS